MKSFSFRLALILALAAATVAATAGAASAKTPCGQEVIDDWYGGHLGRHTYPLKCYRDALKIVANETDLDVYSNARQDILAALQAAIAGRRGGGGGPSDPTSSIYTADAFPSFLGGPDAKHGGHAPVGDQPVTILPRTKTNPGPLGGVLHSPSASSVPLPAIVLGAVAALLLALGLAAYLARRRQQRRQTFRPQPQSGTGRNP